MSDGVRRISSAEVYRNPWMTVREDRVRYADGSLGVYGVVDKPDYALVVPWQDDGFHLVAQFRYPVSARFWEFPQGSWAGAGGPGGAEDLARAELREETGLLAGSLRRLGRVQVAYGYSTQGCEVFLAEDLTPGPAAREATESDMTQRWVSAKDLDGMIRTGRMADAASLAALTLLDRHVRG
jgi:8-oxo-dGTP pyrophosphatase MutT (NUDIX family)